MATDSNSTDRILEASESLQKLTLDPQAKRSEAQNTDEETASHTALETSRQASETAVPVPTSVQPTAVVTPDAAFQPGMYYEQQSNFVPAYFYAGYENAVPEWGEEFPRYVNADGIEVPSHGFFGEKGPVIYHPGFAYAPQMAYGHYSATGMPVSNVRPDASLYGAQHFQYPGHFYQHTVPSAVQYVSAPTQMTQPELMPSVCTDPVPFSTDPHSLNYANPSNISTPNMGYYPISFGSFGPGVMPTNIVPCYDGVNASNSFAELTNVAENQQRPCSAPPMAAVISQPVPAIGGFGQSVHAPLHAIQQQRPLSGVAPSATPYSRVYSPNRTYPLSQSSGRLSPSFGTNGRAWVAIDKNRSKGRATTSCDFPGSMDILSEQNKGPRIRLRNQPSSSDTQGKEHESTSNEKVESDVVVNREQYNKPDFPTTYKSAKFFIIKSYSEDNIHKSIKYGVWASTPSGNKRLDAAYKAAQHKPDGCPVFLFFSVNASGQFCGVAEMLGPVDFEKSVDYWQQDKWSGQFPVRWHIIKDVSNSLFRHIILENNDSKPVTNSRDTQEVPLEKGIEMLEIFKNHSAGASILDDFHYYEVRQKMMQEKKAMQQNYYGFRGPVQEGDRFQATMHINHAIQEIRIPNVQEDYAGASSSRPTEESQTKEDGNGASSSVPTKNKSILLSDSNVKENSQA